MKRKTNQEFILTPNEVKEALAIAFKEWGVPSPSDYERLTVLFQNGGGLTVKWEEIIGVSIST